jgi:hypothetical protein
MNVKHVLAVFLAALVAGSAALAQAPAASQQPKPFAAGTPLSATNEAGEIKKMSNNVKVFGSFHFAESCTFDPDRNLIVAMNAGNPRNAGSPPPLEPNDGFVSLINPDGSVHTSKWIGATRDGLTLVHPLGSAIQGATLYVNDGNMIRTFDLKTGAPKQAFEVREAVNLNGIGVASDGSVQHRQRHAAGKQAAHLQGYAGRTIVRVRRRLAAQPAEWRRRRHAGQCRRCEHRRQRRPDVRQVR